MRRKQKTIEEYVNIENIYSGKERTEAMDRVMDTVKKYSDERVEQWNKEIDGLLTFVCVKVRCQVISLTTCDGIGWFILCDPLGVQCPGLSTTTDVACGPNECPTSADVQPNCELPSPSSPHQFYTARIWKSTAVPCSVPSTDLCHLAKHAMVRFPRL